MARRANQKELERLTRAIHKQPGKRRSFFARLFACSREKVNRQLTTLNDRNVLFYEDDDGGIYPFPPSDWN